MKKKTKSSGKRKLLLLFFATIILTLLLSITTAKLICDGKLPEERTDLSSILITGFVTFLLSLYVSIRSPQKKLLWGLGAAGIYALMLLLGNLLFFGEGYGRVFEILSAVAAGGFLGSVFGGLKRKKYA